MASVTEFIVLHTTKFGENSLVVHTLSRDYGRRGFLVRGIGKNKMSSFLPLNILEANVVESSKSTLFPINNISVKHQLNGIRSDLYKNTMTLFMSEVLYKVLKEGTSEQDIFEWCEKNILLLDAMSESFSNYHIYFLLELTVVLGFGPSTRDIRPFAGNYYQVIKEFVSSSFAEAMMIPLNGADRNEIASRILKYIEFHIESSVNINSLKVLREIYL